MKLRKKGGISRPVKDLPCFYPPQSFGGELDRQGASLLDVLRDGACFQDVPLVELLHGLKLCAVSLDGENPGRFCAEMVCPFHGHHFFSVVGEVISAAEASPVVERHELPFVFLRNLVVLFAVEKKHIQIFPVDPYDARRVFRSLHPSFYFQGIDTCFQDAGQKLQGADILGA